MNDTIMIDFKTTKVRACTFRRPDGSYLTIINSRMAANICRSSYRHEVSHIETDDFDQPDANAAEFITHERKNDAR